MNDKKNRKPAVDGDGNEISREGKWLAGILLILFTLIPIVLIIGLWPDKLPDGAATIRVYRLELFNIQLLNKEPVTGNYIHLNTILFLLVTLSGFLGSMIHIATS